MANFKMDKNGMRKLEQEIARKTQAAVQKGERSAAGQDPEQVAAAVAGELRKLGVEVNEDALRAEYRGRLTD